MDYHALKWMPKLTFNKEKLARRKKLMEIDVQLVHRADVKFQAQNMLS